MHLAKKLGAPCRNFSGLPVVPATFFPFSTLFCLRLYALTMPSRPMNKGQSNDHNFVPPTQYKPHYIKQQPSGFSPLKLIPRFKAIDLNHTISSNQIPDLITSSSPEAIFALFFTHLVIN